MANSKINLPNAPDELTKPAKKLLPTERTKADPVTNKNFDSARSTFDQARSAAMPSQKSLDLASARVRSRLAGREKANAQSIRDRFGGSHNTGGLNRALRQNRQNTDSALAQGFTDLEIDFLDKKQRGAQLLSDIGAGFTNLGGTEEDLNMAAQQLLDEFNLGLGEIGTNLENVLRDFQIGEGRNVIDADENRIREEIGEDKIDVERERIRSDEDIAERRLEQDRQEAIIRAFLEGLNNIGGDIDFGDLDFGSGGSGIQV